MYLVSVYNDFLQAITSNFITQHSPQLIFLLNHNYPIKASLPSRISKLYFYRIISSSFSALSQITTPVHEQLHFRLQNNSFYESCTISSCVFSLPLHNLGQKYSYKVHKLFRILENCDIETFKYNNLFGRLLFQNLNGDNSFTERWIPTLELFFFNSEIADLRHTAVIWRNY